ncbi:helix-turn-helix domain-containing protein [Paraburkholderia bryophila]|nr:helix-turn-helix transcriptional regulator [Paraburkholderia bryophila]WCM24892.1 helix-turn-helix domain-containing protein [Paraburkholderia bryophila]
MSASLKGPDPSQKLASLRDVLAYNVRAYRVKRLLSQEQLGFTAGLDRTFVSQVERARINVSLDNIEKLAAALDVPAATLLQWPKQKAGQHS